MYYKTPVTCSIPLPPYIPSGRDPIMGEVFVQRGKRFPFCEKFGDRKEPGIKSVECKIGEEKSKPIIEQHNYVSARGECVS